jgi:hemoglobin-like flavoprotein
MTPEQIELVKSSWTQVVPIADTAAKLFYGRLFELDPALKPLFRGDMGEQGRKFMRMIGTAVTGLDQLDRIVPAVKNLGVRHATYGVQDSHYDTVGSALLWTLGDAFTPEVETSWATVYGLLADTMKRAGAAAVAA